MFNFFIILEYKKNKKNTTNTHNKKNSLDKQKKEVKKSSLPEKSYTTLLLIILSFLSIKIYDFIKLNIRLFYLNKKDQN